MPKKCTVHILHLFIRWFWICFSFCCCSPAVAVAVAPPAPPPTACPFCGQKRRWAACPHACRLVLVSRALITTLICGIRSTPAPSKQQDPARLRQKMIMKNWNKSAAAVPTDKQTDRQTNKRTAKKNTKYRQTTQRGAEEPNNWATEQLRNWETEQLKNWTSELSGVGGPHNLSCRCLSNCWCFCLCFCFCFCFCRCHCCLHRCWRDNFNWQPQSRAIIHYQQLAILKGSRNNSDGHSHTL